MIHGVAASGRGGLWFHSAAAANPFVDGENAANDAEGDKGCDGVLEDRALRQAKRVLHEMIASRPIETESNESCGADNRVQFAPGVLKRGDTGDEAVNGKGGGMIAGDGQEPSPRFFPPFA